MPKQESGEEVGEAAAEFCVEEPAGKGACCTFLVTRVQSL